ncbi:MAG: hypothetical protein MZU95_08715 [Desulfomicrobium escambiense]|nr:hypothetical protein [Desulfomicrobium escambiense]
MKRAVMLCAAIFAIVPVAFAQEQLMAYASVEQDLAVNLFTAFEKETGIKVNMVRLGSGELEARIEAEKNDPQASIWVGGVGTNHISAQLKGPDDPLQVQGRRQASPPSSRTRTATGSASISDPSPSPRTSRAPRNSGSPRPRAGKTC